MMDTRASAARAPQCEGVHDTVTNPIGVSAEIAKSSFTLPRCPSYVEDILERTAETDSGN